VHRDTEPVYAHSVTLVYPGRSIDTSASFSLANFHTAMERKFDSELLLARQVVRLHNKHRAPFLHMAVAVVVSDRDCVCLIVEYAAPYVHTS
jgi:hypothetical protein